jgi:outer membrane protein TolC
VNRLILSLLIVLPAAGVADPLVLTLDEALQRALDNAPQIETAAAGVDEARAARRQSLAGALPQVTLSHEWFRSDDPVAAFGTRLRQERFTAADFDVERLNQPDAITDARSMVEVRQPLFTSGASLHQRRAARHGEAAALAAQRRTREAVVLQTTAAYWGLRLATDAREVTAAALEAARQHARDARTALAAGAINRGDRLAADLRVAELEAALIDADADVADAADGLTLLLGLPAGTPVEPTEPIDSAAGPAPAPAQPRADLVAARRQASAAADQARAAAAGAWPQLAAFARVAADGETPFSVDGTSWTAGAMLRWDLFSGFAVRGAADAARARARRAAAEAERLDRQATRDRLDAQRRHDAARQRLDVADAAVAHADEHLRITRAEFRHGANSVSALLDAEVAWRGAHLRHLQAWHDVRVTAATLDFAAGLPAPTPR